MYYSIILKDTEGLLSRDDALWLVCHNIESNRLGERTALSAGDDISFLDRKRRRAVHRNILVTLLETTIFGNVVKVVSSDGNGSLHLGRDDKSLQDATANRNVAREWALLVDVICFNGGGWGLESETDRLGESHDLCLALGAYGALAGDKDGILLLVSLFVLIALGIFFRDANHG